MMNLSIIIGFVANDFKMASQVPVSKKTLKPEDKLAPSSKENEKPEDYKQTFRVSQ